jgi:hypothetical protein
MDIAMTPRTAARPEPEHMSVMGASSLHPR